MLRFPETLPSAGQTTAVLEEHTEALRKRKGLRNRAPPDQTTKHVGRIPELLSDWDDLDSEMRLRRFAAATQPS